MEVCEWFHEAYGIWCRQRFWVGSFNIIRGELIDTVFKDVEAQKSKQSLFSINTKKTSRHRVSRVAPVMKAY